MKGDVRLSRIVLRGEKALSERLLVGSCAGFSWSMQALTSHAGDT